MEPKRYWWVLYDVVYPDGYDLENTMVEKVIDIHPFIEKYNIINSKNFCVCRIIDWKLISVEEYNLWNELNNKQ